MSKTSGRRPKSFQVECTVRVSHVLDDLSAHVELDAGVELEPGDSVTVLGPAIVPQLGEVQLVRRVATVRRASWIERAWTRLTGDFECLSLIEVSFSDKRCL